MKKIFTLVLTVFVASTMIACAGPHGGHHGHHHHHGGSMHTRDWVGLGVIAGSAFIGAAVAAQPRTVYVQPPVVIPQTTYVAPAPQTVYVAPQSTTTYVAPQPQVQYVQPVAPTNTRTTTTTTTRNGVSVKTETTTTTTPWSTTTTTTTTAPTYNGPYYQVQTW